MKFAELPFAECYQRLSNSGIYYRIGPFIIHLYSDLPLLAQQIHRLYADYPLVEDNTFADFHVRVYRQGGLHRWWRPQAQFSLDGQLPFPPYPLDAPLPLLEWGLNWCVATRAHHYLLLHAGVVAKDDQAVLLPANPGSGKSTLCGALAHRGWRFLTDEICLVNPTDLRIVPFPRLIPLKNESIEVIRAFSPDAVMGPLFPETRKGRLSHLRPPGASIDRLMETAQARWIVFPLFQKGARLALRPMAKENAFLKLSSSSFNYELIGLRGFRTVSGLIGTCDCYSLEYGDLEEAIAQLDALVTGESPK